MSWRMSNDCKISTWTYRRALKIWQNLEYCYRMASNSAKQTNKHIDTQLLTLMYKYKNDFTSYIMKEDMLTWITAFGYRLWYSPNSNLVITVLETWGIIFSMERIFYQSKSFYCRNFYSIFHTTCISNNI